MCRHYNLFCHYDWCPNTGSLSEYLSKSFHQTNSLQVTWSLKEANFTPMIFTTFSSPNYSTIFLPLSIKDRLNTTQGRMWRCHKLYIMLGIIPASPKKDFMKSKQKSVLDASVGSCSRMQTAGTCGPPLCADSRLACQSVLRAPLRPVWTGPQAPYLHHLLFKSSSKMYHTTATF